MRAFKDYLLDEHSVMPQTIHMSQEADVVKVARTNKGLVLIALTKATELEAPSLRTFKICNTDEIFYANVVKYIDSFEGTLGLRHVIEITEEI
jgi:hypothetical protein